MPTSRPHHISWLCDEILRLRPKTILDVGIGFGSKGMLFREYTDIWNGHYKKGDWKTRIDGIEVFPFYVGEIQKEVYNNIFIGNAIDVIKDVERYDLIYAGDVLEHFVKEDGLKLLKMLQVKSKVLIIATPLYVSAQGSVYENEHETHKSQWQKEDFQGATVKVFGNTMAVIYEP